MTPIRYAPEVEQMLAGEEPLMEQLEQLMVDLAKRVHEKRGHAFHGTHAKLTGLLTGTFEVLPDLAAELAQGLFAQPACYDAVVRLAPGAPEPITDKASGQRGLSIKVLGVTGARVPGFDEQHTQDWVLGLGPAFPSADALAFKRNFQFTGAQSPHLPEPVVLALSRTARAVEAGLEAIGSEAPNIKFFGRPPAHPLAEAFYSQAPVRFGDYIAKLAAVPSTGTLAAVDAAPPLGSGDDRFREAAIAFISKTSAIYDIKVQLCTDLAAMPVEDASKSWDEDVSPYRTVAKLTLPLQRPWTGARAAYDDALAFNPGHALQAHQPLGSIMRARMRAYLAVQRYRQGINRLLPTEPASMSDVP